ncbi:hypothetical protein [Pseudomonas phage PhiPizzaParty]|nr:hypothetical protein [Pseudomonas phage PhiPizzaParty]
MTEQKDYTLVRTPLTHDELKKAFKEDNIHASDVQLDRLVKLSEEVCSAKGNYNIRPLANSKGMVFEFTNKDGEIIALIPFDISKERKNAKIPKTKWLTELLNVYRYKVSKIEVKNVLNMIIDCVKSGGTWQTYMCRDKMVIEFKSDTGKVISELTVHQERTHEEIVTFKH